MTNENKKPKRGSKQKYGAQMISCFESSLRKTKADLQEVTKGRKVENL